MTDTKPGEESTSDGLLPDPEEFLQRNRTYWFLKRIQDILLSSIALLILFPFMLVVSIAIVLDSPGAGPIFSQTRVGQYGKHFTFYKFRSMHPDAEAQLDKLLQFNEMDGPVFKIKNDPRITRVGSILRRTSIDELPQLWNVLCGEMSIVGPRPGIPREVERYDDFARQRLLVPPGLTCYWQIQPYRNQVSFDEWMKLDMKYIRECSFLTDWKIILSTFAVVFGMRGE